MVAKGWLAIGCVVCACTSPSTPEDDVGAVNQESVEGTFVPAILARGESWTYLNAADDPFVNHRSTDGECDGGFGLESGVYEVETGKCGYLTLRQETLADVDAGSCLALDWWHLILTSREPAEAHVLVSIGGQAVMDRRIPIPQPSQTFEERIVLEDAMPAGTELLLHLHNHGANSWRFTDLRTVQCKD